MLILNRSNSSIYSNPDCSVGKEPACNAGDPGLIPGLGRSTGEGIGYPLQYSWAFLMAQLIQNPPAMWETWVWSLGWEDPWRRERLPTPVFWSGEFHGLCGLCVHGVAKSWTQLRNFHCHVVTLMIWRLCSLISDSNFLSYSLALDSER